MHPSLETCPSPLPHQRKLKPSWILRQSNQRAGLRLQRNNLYPGAQSNLVLKDTVMSTMPLLQPDQNLTIFSLLPLFVSQKLSMLLSPHYPHPHPPHIPTPQGNSQLLYLLGAGIPHPVSHFVPQDIGRKHWGQAHREWLKESRLRMGREENEEWGVVPRNEGRCSSQLGNITKMHLK